MKKKIAPESYYRVRSRGDTVCAVGSASGDVRDTLKLYKYNVDDFVVMKSFTSPTSVKGYKSIALGRNVIYVADWVENCIIVLSLEGTVLATHGRYGSGGAGELYRPLAAVTDEQDQLLLCDEENYRLQLMTRDGEWRLLHTDEGIRYPTDAVLVNDKLFVVGNNPNKLYQFTF